MKEISLDELLSQQKQGLFLATIEPVEDQPDNCKLTPWTEGRGCLCSLAVIIPRAAISSVKLTEHRHYCCGKVLFVVEVKFQEGSSIPLDDLFSQMMKAAASITEGHGFSLTGGQSQGIPPHVTMPTPSFSSPFQGAMAPTFGSSPNDPCPYPPNTYYMPCGGKFVCVPPNSECCGGFIPCPPGWHCDYQDSKPVCVPNYISRVFR